VTYKTDRRAALKLLTAAPLGLALSATLAHEAVAKSGARSRTTGPSNVGNALRSVAAQPAADANVINDWNATAVNVIFTDAMTGAAEGFLYHGFVQAAVYDAVVGITRRYSLYQSNATPGPMASPQSAAAAAAHRVLMTYFGHVPAAVTRLTDAYAASIGAGPYDPSTTQGIQYGRQTAERFIALRAEDGRYGPNTFETAAAPGIWRPTAPANAPFFAKFLCETTPLMIESPSQFRPGPPPDLTSAQYAADFAEVKAFGSKEGSARTPQQTETALFISTVGPGPYHAALRDLTVRREMDISDRARLFAAVSISSADAIIACWDSKNHYGFWRPITAIQLADEDGNPATTADPAWDSLIPAPPYPDYTSGLNNVVGSATRALTRVLGTDRIDLTITSPTTNTTRYYEFADQLTADAVDARVWSGIHFRFADEAGKVQGQQVADYAMDRYFTPA
jgi:hypothetical protein